MDVRAARARYFEENGFGADGGYTNRWVKLELGPIPIAFPNTAARVRAVKLHDPHHVATGYATTPTGEAEIGAWEIASGCGGFVAAWVLNLWALAYGAVLAPRAVFRAFVSGRRSGNLYRRGGFDESLLDEPVDALRACLPVADPTDAQVGFRDGMLFGVWIAVAWLWSLAALAVPLALVVWLVRALF